MRILTITNLFPNPWQPQLATFNRNQLKALATKHDVFVISPIAWTTEMRARRDGGPSLPASRRLDWDEIPVEYPRYWYVPGRMRGWYGRFFRRSVRAAFNRALSSFRPDLVYATWAYPDGWAAIDLAKRAGLPTVLKVHGSDILLLDQHPSRRRGTVEALRSAGQIVAVSHDLANKVVELGADSNRVHVVYNGIDTSLFRLGSMSESRQRLNLPPGKMIILFVGNLFPVKGVDMLIEACRILAARRNDFELHLMGKGELRSKLEQQVVQAGLVGRVIFHGSVPNQQLPDWYRAATVFVLPSRSEGVPNVLLEAAACGTPYIASRVGGIPEIAQYGIGRLVEPHSAHRFAEAIDDMLTNPPAATSVQNTPGRSHADSANELVNVFERSIRDKNSSPKMETKRAKISFRQLARRSLAFLLPRRLFMVNGPRSCRSICLTFDDGPHPVLTPKLLDFLGQAKVPATFFLVGRDAEKHPDLVRRMAAEGHAVGSHSYSHPKRAELSSAEMVEEVGRGKSTVDEILGFCSRLYRPPNGKVTARDLWWMWRAGLSVVLWNVDPRDFAAENSNAVRTWFHNRCLQPGDVVLFHDTHPHALAVLPELIDAVRQKGLTFTTINEWIE